MALAEEAVRPLLPHLLRLPQAQAGLMGAIVRDYRRRCDTLGRAPDAELLAPLVAIFERLQAGDREPDG